MTTRCARLSGYWPVRLSLSSAAISSDRNSNRHASGNYQEPHLPRAPHRSNDDQVCSAERLLAGQVVLEFSGDFLRSEQQPSRIWELPRTPLTPRSAPLE